MGLRFNREDATLGSIPVVGVIASTSTTPAPLDLPNRSIDWTMLTPGTTGQVLTVNADTSIAWAANAIPTALTTFTATAGAFTGGIGVWGSAVPGAQPTAAAEVTGYTAGSSTAVTIDGTFTGGTGSTAYTIGDIVAALKTQGLITS